MIFYILYVENPQNTGHLIIDLKKLVLETKLIWDVNQN